MLIKHLFNNSDLDGFLQEIFLKREKAKWPDHGEIVVSSENEKVSLRIRGEEDLRIHLGQSILLEKDSNSDRAQHNLLSFTLN